MSEATTEGRFCIDLPDSDAATALAGTGHSTLIDWKPLQVLLLH